MTWRSRLNPLGILAFLMALAGIGLLARGIVDAAPVVFFSTDEEFESLEQGREILLQGSIVVMAAGVIMLIARKYWNSLAIIVPAGLLALFGSSDHTLLVLVLFFVASISAFISGIHATREWDDPEPPPDPPTP